MGLKTNIGSFKFLLPLMFFAQTWAEVHYGSKYRQFLISSLYFTGIYPKLRWSLPSIEVHFWHFSCRKHAVKYTKKRKICINNSVALMALKILKT